MSLLIAICWKLIAGTLPERGEPWAPRLGGKGIQVMTETLLYSCSQLYFQLILSVFSILIGNIIIVLSRVKQIIKFCEFPHYFEESLKLDNIDV